MTYKITKSEEMKAILEDTLTKINDYSLTLMKAEEEEKKVFAEYHRKLRLIENKYDTKRISKEMKKLQDNIPELEGGIYKEFYINLFNIMEYYEERGMNVSGFIEDDLGYTFDLLLITRPELSQLHASRNGLYIIHPGNEDSESWDDEGDGFDYVMTWEEGLSSEKLEEILNDLDLRLRLVYLAGITQKFIRNNDTPDVRQAIEELLSSVDIKMVGELSNFELTIPGSFITRTLPSKKFVLERAQSASRLLIFGAEKDINEVQKVIEEGLCALSKKLNEDAEYAQYLKLKEKFGR